VAWPRPCQALTAATPTCRWRWPRCWPPTTASTPGAAGAAQRVGPQPWPGLEPCRPADPRPVGQLCRAQRAGAGHPARAQGPGPGRWRPTSSLG
jgi:hypothetical protein